MRRLLAGAIVLAACAAAFVLSGASDKKKTRTYKVVFDNAFGLVEGGDFRVGGVRAGKTTGFSVTKQPGHAPKAVVTAEVDQPGFDDFRADASCSILPQSLIGEYYVDCQPGKSKRALPHNTVPVSHTASTIPQDLVQDVMRRPTRERFRLIVTELGTGLAGRPGDLQAVLKRAHPGLRETSKVLRILGNQNRIIERFISNSDTIVRELEANKKDVVRFVKEAGDTAEISATRRDDIRRSFERLPRFLDELRPTMVRLGQLADQQTPLLTELQRAAPDLNTFLKRLGPFSQVSRPAVRTLGDAASVGTRAFQAGRADVRELNALAPDAPPTFKRLRQFLQTMDDRNRSVENDPRAVASAPPPPDPTAIRNGGAGEVNKGFTGFEDLWDYFYWQSLDINGFDRISHLLRVGIDITCSTLTTSREMVEAAPPECRQWLGPDQPGITTPDPTANSAAARSLRARDRRPASRAGERRSPGRPAAGPVAGQADNSRPRVTLPSSVKQLISEVSAQRRPTVQRRAQQLLQGAPQSSSGMSDAQLLDFLLGP